jgi:hypothetical protein
VSARWPHAYHRRAPSRTTVAVMAALFALVLVAAAITDREAGGGASLGNPSRSPAPTGGTPTTTTTTTTTPTTTTAAAGGPGRPPLGIYVGAGNAAAAEQLATGLPLPYALDYLPGDSWQTIADPSWILARWVGTNFSMIWGVPMLPGSGAVPAAGATLAGGAAGEYDPTFYALGQRLVAAGQANAILMIGYDPTVATNPWVVTTAAQAHRYVEYWRQIVTALRSVPGAQFRFEWDVAAGPAAVAPAALYPGDAYVDIVATDAFDISTPGTTRGGGWPAQAAVPDGADWLASFAARHGKELMIAKWGLVPKVDGGRGDDVAFVDQFLAWCADHQVAAAVLWDDGAWGLTDGGFPSADAAFAALEQTGGQAGGT